MLVFKYTVLLGNRVFIEPIKKVLPKPDKPLAKYPGRHHNLVFSVNWVFSFSCSATFSMNVKWSIFIFFPSISPHRSTACWRQIQLKKIISSKISIKFIKSRQNLWKTRQHYYSEVPSSNLAVAEWNTRIMT